MLRPCQIVFIIASALIAPLAMSAKAANSSELQGRRQRAAAAFSDGILLVHALFAPDDEMDGFRQDPLFYYFTGLENTAGAILAIDGRSRESWLFLPTRALFWNILPPEGSPDSAAVRAAGIEHVGDWDGLKEFLTRASASQLPLYYIGDQNAEAELPPDITGQPGAPAGRRYLEPAGDAHMGGAGCEPLAVFPCDGGARSGLRANGRAGSIRIGEPSRGH